jgi:hypothetical protein
LINYYVSRLAGFHGAEWGGAETSAEQINGRSFDLIVPRGKISKAFAQTGFPFCASGYFFNRPRLENWMK